MSTTSFKNQAAEKADVTDTIPDVIHDAAQRPNGRRRSSIVDNSAENAPHVGDKLSAAADDVVPNGKVHLPKIQLSDDAPMQARFNVPQPARLGKRSPACIEVPVQKSKRTSAGCGHNLWHEGILPVQARYSATSAGIPVEKFERSGFSLRSRIAPLLLKSPAAIAREYTSARARRTVPQNMGTPRVLSVHQTIDTGGDRGYS